MSKGSDLSNKVANSAVFILWSAHVSQEANSIRDTESESCIVVDVGTVSLSARQCADNRKLFLPYSVEYESIFLNICVERKLLAP